MKHSTFFSLKRAQASTVFDHCNLVSLRLAVNTAPEQGLNVQRPSFRRRFQTVLHRKLCQVPQKFWWQFELHCKLVLVVLMLIALVSRPGSGDPRLTLILTCQQPFQFVENTVGGQTTVKCLTFNHCERFLGEKPPCTSPMVQFLTESIKRGIRHMQTMAMILCFLVKARTPQSFSSDQWLSKRIQS